MGRYRWVICALLFFAATINYIDRQVIGILKPTLQAAVRLERNRLRDIVFAFQLAYAVGLLIAGRLIDRLGARIGFAVAIVVWSLAAMAHAEAPAFGGSAGRRALALIGSDLHGLGRRLHLGARSRSGLGEAGNFPAAIKIVAEWFPKRERALATGLFNSGTNVGALVTPLIVPWITITWGWYWAFVATGALGFLWLACLVARSIDRPEQHPRVSAGGARLHSQRSGRVRRSAFRGARCCAPADVGVRDRQVPDRSGLVALSVLDSGLPQPEPRARSAARSGRRSSRSISSPTSAASAAAGCRPR